MAARFPEERGLLMSTGDILQLLLLLVAVAGFAYRIGRK